MGIWEYGNMRIWEYEDYSTHISATAELVAYIHVPIQAMLDSYTNKAFFLLLDNLLRPAPWPYQY